MLKVKHYNLGDVIRDIIYVLSPIHTGTGHVVQPTLHVQHVETENIGFPNILLHHFPISIIY